MIPEELYKPSFPSPLWRTVIGLRICWPLRFEAKGTQRVAKPFSYAIDFLKIFRWAEKQRRIRSSPQLATETNRKPHAFISCPSTGLGPDAPFPNLPPEANLNLFSLLKQSARLKNAALDFANLVEFCFFPSTTAWMHMKRHRPASLSVPTGQSLLASLAAQCWSSHTLARYIHTHRNLRLPK